MTDDQKLTLAIQNEIACRSMRELALNSLRFNFLKPLSIIDQLGKSEAEFLKYEIEQIDKRIIASIPDDYRMFPKQLSGTFEPTFTHDA